MPGNEEKVIVTIGDQEFTIEPLRGLQSILVIPKLLSIIARMAHAAGKTGLDLFGLFEGDMEKWIETLSLDALLAIPYITDVLSENWPELTQIIYPTLLGKGAKADFLAKNGTLEEHANAFWKAIQANAPALFGGGAMEALKKSVAAEAAAEQETPSEPSEVSP